MFWFAYISDLGFWLAFVWSIISVLLCQHSFGDVWSCFSIGSLRLCISFSLHHHEHIPEYLVRWHSVSHVDYYLTLGHTPRPWVHHFSFTDFLADHSISWPLWVVILGHTPILEFIDVLQTSLITRSISWSLRVIIPRHTPFSAFLLGHTPLSLGLPCLVLISWLSDPFVDPYELSLRASPFCHLV